MITVVIAHPTYDGDCDVGGFPVSHWMETKEVDSLRDFWSLAKEKNAKIVGSGVDIADDFPDTTVCWIENYAGMEL